MNLRKKNRTLSMIIGFFILLTGCNPVFENNYDVMARQALLDLAKAQESYRAKHNKYTKEIAQLFNHNLEYHSGIVYLEIHSAEKDSYRAISLPAESTTARVFVYDTSKGGFHEAGEVEVSKYVLGALNFIRGEKDEQNQNVLLATILMVTLFIFGVRFTGCYWKGKNKIALISYFTSLIPLGWAVAVLNHLNGDIVFSTKITILSLSSMIISAVSSILSSRWLKNINPQNTPSPILGLAGCTLFISLVSVGAVAYTFQKYYPI